MIRLFAIALLALGLGATSPASAGGDATTLVWNHQAGAVTLGMQQAAVEYVYGPSTKTDRWTLPHVDSKYHDKVVHAERYRIASHMLWAWYIGQTVRVVETSSPYYRTMAGIGVGSSIPLGSCVKRKGYCEYRWHDFRLLACGGGQMWVAATRTTQTVLYMKRGKVTNIQIGSPDVILLCY